MRSHNIVVILLTVCSTKWRHIPHLFPGYLGVSSPWAYAQYSLSRTHSSPGKSSGNSAEPAPDSPCTCLRQGFLNNSVWSPKQTAFSSSQTQRCCAIYRLVRCLPGNHVYCFPASHGISESLSHKIARVIVQSFVQELARRTVWGPRLDLPSRRSQHPHRSR